jgi:hypothetical protein
MEPSSLIESLRTTMTLSYAWQYDVQVRSLRELYTKSKDLQWDGARALPWHLSVDPEGPNFPDEVVPIYGHPLWERLTQRERVALKREVVSWMLSQFLHGEQGALLATSQIVTTVQSMDAKFYGATQVMDEARHVEVYARYLSDKMQLTYPVTPTLKQLLDVILTDSRWDFKYLGMQIMVEGLALAAFGVMREMTDEPPAQAAHRQRHPRRGPPRRLRGALPQGPLHPHARPRAGATARTSSSRPRASCATASLRPRCGRRWACPWTSAARLRWKAP